MLLGKCHKIQYEKVPVVLSTRDFRYLKYHILLNVSAVSHFFVRGGVIQ